MQNLVNDLLDYSRLGRMDQPFAPVDCQAIFEQAQANLAGVIEASKAQISCDPLPPVQGNAGQLERLFQNLIGNALKFRGDAPLQVRVSVERQKGWWRFAVTDNGIGIEPEYFERIFVIFQRLHNRADYPGTGIGLTTCKKIVERHGGQIWVESQPGQGATFYFTLPA